VQPKSAICLLVDGLHAGLIGAYGNSWIRTPSLDRLASEGFLFDQAFVECPELPTIYDSLWNSADAWGASTPRLLETLRASGIRLWLLTDNAQVSNWAGDRFDEIVLLPIEPVDELAEEIEDTHLARLFAAAGDLVERIESPALVWIHTSALTTAWDAPLDLRDQYRDEEDPEPATFARVPDLALTSDFDPDELMGIIHAYAGQVSLLDACLGLWLPQLATFPALSNCLLSVSGLRGFALGEHGRVGIEENGLGGEAVQIPWIMRLPDGTGSLGRTSGLVCQKDLAATLLDWFDAGSSNAPSDSTSALPFIAGEGEPTRQAVFLRSSAESGVRTPAWHLRLRSSDQPPARLLYAKASDRWEVNEVSNRCSDIADSLEALVLAKQAGNNPSEALPAELMTQMD
jgi:arylsulfatase A-like enzyme